MGQKAEPACQLVAGVSCRLGGDAVGLSWDEPFSCQPPATGEGIVPGGGPARVGELVVGEWSCSCPLAVVTVTSTVPVPAGAVAVIVVGC